MKTASAKKRKPFRLQFSFRWFMVVFTLICAGFGFYMANRSVTFLVPAVMPNDEGTSMRVSEVIEHKASWFADSIADNALRLKITYGLPDADDVTPELEAARVRYLLDDLNNIYHHSERDLELIDRHAAEFKAAAAKAFATPEHFGHAVGAAAVLARLGETERVEQIVDRYIAAGSRPDDLYRMCICFSRNQTAKEPKFVECLKTQIENTNCSARYRGAFVRQLSDIDPELYATLRLRIAKDSAVESMKNDSITWLIENRPNDETFELAIKFLSEPVVQGKHYHCVRVLGAVLKSHRFQKEDPEFQKRFVPLAERLATLHIECLQEVVSEGGIAFESFFRKVIADPRSSEQLSSVFNAVETGFAEADYLSLLRATFETSKYAEGIFDRCIRSLGEAETIEIVKSRWNSEKAHWMFLKICEHSPTKNEDDMSHFFTEAFEAARKVAPVEYSFSRKQRLFEVLNFMRKFGYGELASRLAASEQKLKDHWFDDSIDAKEYLDWFNRHFDLKKPLTGQDVSIADTNARLSLCDVERVFEARRFKVATFQAAGFGGVIDPENHMMDGGLFAEICELAGDEFRVEHHDVVDDHRVRLGIGKYVYEFAMSDDWSWYEDAPACDLLNAILERRRIQKRFFVFKYAYGNSYVRFVLFAAPSKVKGFLDAHQEFEVEDGCERYWQ